MDFIFDLARIMIVAGLGAYIHMHLAVIVHEAGHLVFGKLTGYKLVSFRAGRLVWFREDNRIKFKIHKAPFAGQCLMSPPETGKFRFVWYNLGGGIFDLILVVVCFLVLLPLRGSEFGTWGTFMVQFFVMGIVINLMLAILNLAPITVGGMPVDGRNVLTALKSDTAKHALQTMFVINNEMAQGKRYKDFPPEMFEVESDANLNNYLVAWLVICSADRLNELGEHDQAIKQFARLNPDKLPGFYANEIRLNLIYHYTIHRPNFEKAKILHEHKNIKAFFKKSQTEDFAWVVAAYEYFVEGNHKRAEEVLARALESVKNRPNMGERVMCTDELERVAKLIDYAKSGKPKWTNVLLTDAGFYYDNELDKPLIPLIRRFWMMLGKPFTEAKILFIPTAAMQNKDKADEITKRLCSELLQMGVLSTNITVHDIDGSLTEAEAMAYDVIYFTGGNTPYLAKRVWAIEFDKIIRKMVYANKVYIGMSAGSMLAMANFNVDGLPEETPMDFVGLGLINAYFTVHCAPGTPNRTDFPLPHISLKCNQGIAVSWNGYEVISG